MCAGPFRCIAGTIGCVNFPDNFQRRTITFAVFVCLFTWLFLSIYGEEGHEGYNRWATMNRQRPEVFLLRQRRWRRQSMKRLLHWSKAITHLLGDKDITTTLVFPADESKITQLPVKVLRSTRKRELDDSCYQYVLFPSVRGHEFYVIQAGTGRLCSRWQRRDNNMVARQDDGVWRRPVPYESAGYTGTAINVTGLRADAGSRGW